MSAVLSPAEGIPCTNTRPGQPTPPPAWYVLQTKPRQELRARDNLANQGIRCHLPMLRVEKVRRHARQ